MIICNMPLRRITGLLALRRRQAVARAQKNRNRRRHIWRSAFVRFSLRQILATSPTAGTLCDIALTYLNKHIK